MAETNTLITEEDIQKQRELVSKLEANMQSLQTRLPEFSARIESLTKQIEEKKNDSMKKAQAQQEVYFEETITMMPQMYEELRKKYQMIENDPQLRILQDEVRKAELDTVYGPNPDYDRKNKELEVLRQSNQETLEALKTQMASYRPIEISQLDRILNRYRDADLNPEDMYYPDFESDRDFLEQLANQYFPDVNREEKSKEVVLLEQEQAKLQVQRDILAEEVRKAELDTVYGPNPIFDQKNKELEKLDEQLNQLSDTIKKTRQTSIKQNPIDRMVKEYHDLRERVERARNDDDDRYLEFDKEQKMLHEIERAAFLHFNHRDKEVAVVVPESDTNDLEEELKKAQDEHNKIIGDVNKSRADYNEAKDKLDELTAKKKEQDKKAEPPVNPFDNSETATIKATRWECKFQGYAKKGLVKIATSTAFGKRIYDNLRAKRAEKYAKKLNRLQEVYDVANANYNRIEGNYNRIANEISNMQNLIDQKLEFEKLQQKVNNEKKSVQIIMQRRVALFKKSLDLLNIPDDQKRKISETEVRQMLETKSDQMSKEMLGQLKKYADLMKKANNAMKKDAEELANVKNQYHQRLKQRGYDSATDSKNLEIQIMTRLDKAIEEQQNFDYSQLETLANDRARAEKKLDQFKNYVQRNGATITPVEVELNPDELTERKVKSSAPKQTRFSVWFDGLKQRFSRNKDEELAEYAFENAGEVDEEKEKLASFAFANAGELDSNPKENSPESITSNNTSTKLPKEPSEEQDFSVPIQPIEKSQNAPVGLPVKPSVVSTQAPQHPEQIRVVRPSKKTSEESTIASNLQKAILGTEESRLQARADKFEKDSAKTVMPTQDSKDVTKQESTPKEDYSAYEDQTVHQLSEIGIDYNSLSDAAKKAAREHFVKHFASDDSAKTDESTRHM